MTTDAVTYAPLWPGQPLPPDTTAVYVLGKHGDMRRLSVDEWRAAQEQARQQAQERKDSER